MTYIIQNKFLIFLLFFNYSQFNSYFIHFYFLFLKSVGRYYLSLNIFHILSFLKSFFYVSEMNFIELMTDCKSSLFSLMRWNNLIRLYAAVIVNIRF